MNTPETHIITVTPGRVLPGRSFAECTCGSMIGGTNEAVGLWLESHAEGEPITVVGAGY